MSKKTTGREVVMGAAILGLLTGGTAMASTRQATQNGRFFEVKELKAGYELAKSDKDQAHKVKTEKACNAKSCKDKSCKDKSCKDKSCKDKDGKKADKDCGENSCGSKDGKKSK